MDDLFQYLIYGIIIFSFLSSFFKKKEPPKPPLPGTKPKGSVDFPKTQSDVSLSETTRNQNQYDILREIENMFKGDLKIPEQPKSQTLKTDPYDIYESTKIEDKDLDLRVDERLNQDVMDQNPIGYRNAYDEGKGNIKSSTSRSKKKIDSKTETEAEKFKKVLSGLENKIAAESKIRRKIKNPDTLKDFIIFSEILGKPKSLRR